LKNKHLQDKKYDEKNKTLRRGKWSKTFYARQKIFKFSETCDMYIAEIFFARTEFVKLEELSGLQSDQTL
jgi:hypothetical protein